MSSKRILFVEDDEGQKYSFNVAIRGWNGAHEDRHFEPQFASTVAEARSLMSFYRFDCALFDLKLPQGDGPGAGDGNELAQAGLVDYGIPVGIISGHTGDVAEALRRRPTVRVFEKIEDDAFEQAIAWLGSFWPMMETLAFARAEIRRSGAEVFADRVWPHWSEYEGVGRGPGVRLGKVVARQYASHIAEHLAQASTGEDGWHPFEHYFVPALQTAPAQTGDIFQLNGILWVVLTPACDMATGKASTVLLARCDTDVLQDWAERVAELRDEQLGREKREKRDRYFQKLINQSEPGKHFLPPLPGKRPMFVEFKDLRTVSRDELNQAERVASIAPPFLPNLTQRFGAYVSRTGQPDIHVPHFS